MRRKEKLAHIALGSLVVMVGLLAMGSFSLAKAEGTWTTRADMPTRRWELSTCVVDGKIYAIGGASSYGSKPLRTVEEYDPATDTWTTKSEMPTARGWHSANVVDGRIYVIGGTSSGPWLGYVRTVEVYDPATDTWTQKGDIPAPRGAGFTSVVDGKIYAFGGYGSLRRVHEYEPATDTWTQKADMPTSRVSPSTSVVDGKIYVIGGHRGSSPYPGIATVDVYDPATDTWTTAPDMPTATVGPRTSVVDGKIYAFGGAAIIPGGACGTVEEYDPGRTVEVSFASAVAGQPTPLEVTVGLGRPLEETETLRRMILDLSPLGIPDDLPLEHVGAGRYTVSTTVTPLRSGHCDVLILMETTEGKRYRFFTATLDVYPVRDDYLYQDQMGARWEAEVSSAGTLDLTGSDVVHGGSYSQAITLQTGGSIKYTFEDPDGLSTFGYTGLQFWIHPGTSSTEQFRLVLSIAGKRAQYLELREDLGITLEPDVWQMVSIPLEELGLVDVRLKYLKLDHVEGRFYIDDLAFVVAEYRLEEAMATPERIKADGTMSTLLTVQTVPGVVEPGAPPTVTIDLTPIGGASDAVMVDDGTGGDHVAGDGIYTLRTTVDPEIENGLKELIVTSTDRRLRLVRTPLSVGVVPVEDKYLYQDEVEAGWTLSRLYKAEVNPSSTDYVHSGSYAYAITMQTGGQVDYTVDDPDGLPTFGYTTLEFWLNPGSASMEELKIVAMSRGVSGGVLPLVEQMGLSFEAERWQRISIPLAALELTDAHLERIRFIGDVQGTFYLDDIRLVPEEVEIPPTAVEEVSEATALPLGYSLSQNYPNPFNPVTAVAYDLPETSDVTLTIYTVTGQKVAVLVHAHQEAGHHRILFDGSGFATGVYLYHLEAGGFVETQTMVLLK